MSLALNPAHRHLSPADFDDAYGLAKRLTRINNAKEHFEIIASFWTAFSAKPNGLSCAKYSDNWRTEALAMSRFCSSFFPPETRPRQREVLIESYRKGKIAEAFRAFKKIYLEIVDEVIDHLKSEEPGHSIR
jgi:hypothetical protein